MKEGETEAGLVQLTVLEAPSLRLGQGLGPTALPELTVAWGARLPPLWTLPFLVPRHLCSVSVCLEISSICTPLPNTEFSQVT